MRLVQRTAVFAHYTTSKYLRLTTNLEELILLDNAVVEHNCNCPGPKVIHGNNDRPKKHDNNTSYKSQGEGPAISGSNQHLSLNGVSEWYCHRWIINDDDCKCEAG